MSRFDKPVFDRTHTALPHPSAGAPQSAGSMQPGGTGLGVLNLKGIGMSRVRLRRAATQTIANNAAANITWDTSIVDTDMYDPTLVSAVTIPYTGQYIIIANARFVTQVGNERQLWIEQNGTPLPNLVDNRTGIATFNTSLAVQGIAAFVTQDVIRARVLQNTGAPLNMNDADIQLVYLGPS